MKSTWIIVVSSVAFVLGPFVSLVNGEKVYWVGLDGVLRANLDGSRLEVLVQVGLVDPKDIALDVARGKMYWTDAGSGKIQRANLQIPPGETPDNRTDIEDLVTGLSRPGGIALDVGGGKMYWTTSAPYKVQRSNLDGSAVEDLVTTGLGSPLGIALDVPGAKVYWTDLDKIQRADLDGSNVEDLVVATGDSAPFSLALDVGAGKMYWMSAGVDFALFPKIQRANLDGSDVEVVVDPAGFGIGIAVDPGAGKVYWTYMVGGTIVRANLDGSGFETVLNTGGGNSKESTWTFAPLPSPRCRNGV